MITISIGGGIPVDKLCPQVRKIYEENEELFEDVGFDTVSDERKFYVYEQFTLDKGKVFYVGKGTGSRHNYIRRELDTERGMY